MAAGCRCSAGSRGASVRSPGFRSRLLCVLHGPRLADHRDLDLTGIGQRLLDLADDVAGQPGGGEVVDLLGPDEDADFAPGLDGKRLLDAGEALGDGLEVLEP